MQKIFCLLFTSVIAFSSCDSGKKEIKSKETATADTDIFFPVTDFLLGQVHQLDSLQLTPLKIVETENGKQDSTWMKREDIQSFVTPFLTPVIDSISMSAYFSVKSFFDQTINSVTLTYEPKVALPDSMHLRRWDVYIDPQSGTVRKIYIVKDEVENGINKELQLIWNVDNNCSIRSIIQKPDTTIIKMERLMWNFDQ
jgi:hypothetical protein